MSISMATLHAQPASTLAPAVVPARMPLWDMGFRPFFLGAIVYAAIAMGILGAWHLVDDGMRLSVVAGVYLIIGLVLTMARRLIPFFTERGAGHAVTLRNSTVVDAACLATYVVFFMLLVFTGHQHAAGVLAMALCGLHAWRLAGWYTPALACRPLLWSLHFSYGCMVLAFALQAAAAFGQLPATLALHMFALGGIGLITVSMMMRVTIGHTGRDMQAPPPAFKAVLALAIASLVMRVLLPMVMPAQYFALLVAAQLLWIASFTVLAWLLVPMLVGPRADTR